MQFNLFKCNFSLQKQFKNLKFCKIKKLQKTFFLTDLNQFLVIIKFAIDRNMFINLFKQMQKNNKIQGSLDKGLFTFYKQQQHYLSALQLGKLQVQLCQQNDEDLNKIKRSKNKSKNSKNYQASQKITPNKNNQAHQRPFQAEEIRMKRKKKKSFKMAKQKNKLPKTQLLQSSGKSQEQITLKASGIVKISEHLLGKELAMDWQINRQKRQNSGISSSFMLSSKKTIVSDTIMQLKPFEHKSLSHSSSLEQTQFRKNIYAAIDSLTFAQNHKLNPQNNEDNCDRNDVDFQALKLNSQDPNKVNSKDPYKWKNLQEVKNQAIAKSIKQKFLSNIISVRKNNTQLKKLNQNHNSNLDPSKGAYSNEQQYIFQTNRFQIVDTRGQIHPKLLQNDQISNFIVLQKNSQPIKKYKCQKSIIKKGNQKKTLQPNIIRLKTQNIQPANGMIYSQQANQRVQQLFTQNSSLCYNQRDPTTDVALINQKCMPAHKSSFTVHEMKKKENQSIVESLNLLQYYKKLKSNPNKLLRFSLLRNANSLKNYSETQHNQNLINNQSKSLISQKLDTSESIQNKCNDKAELKFPPISNALSLKQKKGKDGIEQIMQNSTQKTSNQFKQSVRNRLMKDFHKKIDKLSHGQGKDDIKKRLRCYTQECHKIKKVYEPQSKNMNNESKTTVLMEQEDELKKCSSSKIINSFHQKYYKRFQVQKQSKRIISMLDMSQNSVFHYKQSFEWQFKKKQIQKKLGIKI